MRQTLLRFVFDSPFAWKWVQDDEAFVGWGSAFYVGFGWLLIPWLMLLLFGLWTRQQERTQTTAKEPPPLLQWTPSFVVFLCFPVLLFAFSGKLTQIWPDGIPVFGYGFMLFLAFIVSGWVASRRAKREGLPPEIIWDLGMLMFFSGIVGARLFHLVQYREENFGPNDSLQQILMTSINLSNGGMVLYGGMILGLVVYLVFCYLRKLSPLYMADLVLPASFLGVAFGRFGCFLNGCCYGDRCALPWGVRYPEDSSPYISMVNRGILNPDATVSLPLHPSQIYSSLNGIVLFVLLSLYFRYRTRNGTVLALSLFSYAITRFFIEFIRADETGQFSTSLTISQWVSIGMATTAIALGLWLRTQPPHLGPELRGKSGAK